jgi:hypothetical protein
MPCQCSRCRNPRLCNCNKEHHRRHRNKGKCDFRWLWWVLIALLLLWGISAWTAPQKGSVRRSARGSARVRFGAD